MNGYNHQLSDTAYIRLSETTSRVNSHELEHNKWSNDSPMFIHEQSRLNERNPNRALDSNISYRI
jgi:hypothetical protein